MSRKFDLISEVGEVCFGPNWRDRMANNLHTTTKTLNRWDNGETELTEALWERREITQKLSRILKVEGPKRKRYLAQADAEYEQRAASLQAELDKLK